MNEILTSIGMLTVVGEKDATGWGLQDGLNDGANDKARNLANTSCVSNAARWQRTIINGTIV